MEKKRAQEQAFPIWVDWEKRIVSFQKADGFGELAFPTHAEMFRFAIEKSLSGFSIQ